MTFRSAFYQGLPIAAFIALAMSSCNDTDFDRYYERPGWLESPAHSVLASRSDCKIYLQLVEKTLYAKQLEGSGSYTFFVPTDDAFQKFFASNEFGWRSVNDIPADKAAEIVSYSMLFNSYPCDSIGSVLEGYGDWTTGGAYKHQTPSYSVLERDFVNGDSIWVYDYLSGNTDMHNYRYLPVFTSKYFSANNLKVSDYNHFYPNSPWSQYGNVLGAQIQQVSEGSGDLYCENGVIHLVDQVIVPLKNIDRMIRDYGEGASSRPTEAKEGSWDILKRLYYHKIGNGTYRYLRFSEDKLMTHYFEKMYPDYDLSTLKMRNNLGELQFAFNIEDYVSFADAEGDNSYNSGITLFVPSEEAMKEYVGNRILSYVAHEGWDESQESLDKAFNLLSNSVTDQIWASILSNGIIWPSQYKNAQNMVGSNEFINGGANGNEFSKATVKSSAFASNGVYHVVNFFPKTSAFEGVGSRFLLDPKYSYFEQVFAKNYSLSVYSNMLLSPFNNNGNINLSVILYSDQSARRFDGIVYDAVDGIFKNGANADVNTNFNRMALFGYVERDTLDRFDFEVDPLNGAYGGWAFTTNSFGELIRYKKTGKSIEGKPEIMVQSLYSIFAEQAPDTALTSYPASWQVENPKEGYYTSIYKDPSYDAYVNGNVYLAKEGTAPLYYGDPEYDTYTSLEYYLRMDAASANPRHTIFKGLWDMAKGAGTPPALGSGFWTILVPTDKALQVAVDKELMYTANQMKILAGSNPDASYADTAAMYINAYLIKSDLFPDDGAKTLYSSNVWSSPSAPIDLGTSGFPVTTMVKPMSNDWEDLMSGTTSMTAYINKVGADHKLRFLARNYIQGDMTAVYAYNGTDVMGSGLSNCVIRELGQSNVIANRGVIHSFDGYLIYKVVNKE